MNRPLERCGIDELEARARKKGVPETELRVLESELTHRSSSRAEKLLADVRQSLRSTQMFDKVHTKSAENTSEQAELPGFAPAVIPVIAPKPVLSAPKPVTRTAMTVNPSKPPTAQMLNEQAMQSQGKVKGPMAPLQQMTNEQAYKCLKVSPSAGWEQIENARQEIVARSQPDRLEGLTPERCKSLQDGSRLANAAYKALLQR